MPFPTYILPALPFRRKSSTASDASASSSSPSSPISPNQPCEPRAALDTDGTLLGAPVSYIRCARCAVELCFTDQIVSRGFTGRFGRAYLVAPFESVHDRQPARNSRNSQPTLPNTHTLKAVPRQLVTGAHTVSDVICASCGVGLGWKYVNADEESQRYKIGKFILETKRVSTANRWEADEIGGVEDSDWGSPLEDARLEQIMKPTIVDGQEIEFDSQDEDECEDLFLGQWTPESAAKRRKLRRFVKS